MKEIFILGYSEAMIAMVLESYWAHGHNGKATVICNQPVNPVYPYLPPGHHCLIIQEQDWKDPGPTAEFIFGVGKTNSKQAVYNHFLQSHGITRERYGRVFHPSFIAASSATIKTGFYGEPGSVLSPFTETGFGVTINRGVTIGHHTTIGDFVSINPGAHIAGHCRIGHGVTIGMGAVVFDHVSIGEGSVIGGGSVVTKDIPAGVLAYGNPCTVIRPIHEKK